MFSAAVFHGSSSGSWNTTPILSGRGRSMRSPSIRTSPLVATLSPAMICSSVDFPHPLGPTIETNWPSWTDSETSSSAVNAPGAVAERFADGARGDHFG